MKLAISICFLHFKFRHRRYTVAQDVTNEFAVFIVQYDFGTKQVGSSIPAPASLPWQKAQFVP